jgi:protein SCO1/2
MRNLLVLTLLFSAAASVGFAQTPEDWRNYFTDTPLVDQDGNSHRFYTDLLKGHTVVMNFMFTACRNSCPVMAGNFANIQKWLGDRLGKSVLLLSFTVDPDTDTASTLKAYAMRMKARPGWYFLTGTKDDLKLVLQRLGQYVEQRDDHQNLFLIVNEPAGLMKKAFGMAGTRDLIATIDSVISGVGAER